MTSRNWSPTDPVHFEGKSTSELQKRLKDANEFTRKHPQFAYGWHNEYCHELKRRIAERIGK
jgi:hypothetical protein